MSATLSRREVREALGSLVISNLKATALVCILFFQGFVIAKLWGWFVVPRFGLPSLGIISAMGLTLLVSAIRLKAVGKAERERRRDQMWDEAGFYVGTLLMSLIIGWILNAFV